MLLVSVVRVVGSSLRLQVLVPIIFTIVALEVGLLIMEIRRVTPLCTAPRLMTVRVGHRWWVVVQPVPFRLDENVTLGVVPTSTDIHRRVRTRCAAVTARPCLVAAYQRLTRGPLEVVPDLWCRGALGLWKLAWPSFTTSDPTREEYGLALQEKCGLVRC